MMGSLPLLGIRGVCRKGFGLALIALLAAAVVGGVNGKGPDPNFVGHGTTGRMPDANLTLLDSFKYPNARCMDGSHGGYYINTNPAGSKLWIIEFQSGGECVNPKSCGTRTAASYRGSTRVMPRVLLFDGLQSTNPYRNPRFGDANMVLIPYCSGDLFSGRKTEPVEELEGRFFGGAYILDAVFQELLDKHALKEAHEILIAGRSAGAMGVFLNLDRVAGMIKNYSPGKALGTGHDEVSSGMPSGESFSEDIAGGALPATALGNHESKKTTKGGDGKTEEKVDREDKDNVKEVKKHEHLEEKVNKEKEKDDKEEEKDNKLEKKVKKLEKKVEEEEKVNKLVKKVDKLVKKVDKQEEKVNKESKHAGDKDGGKETKDEHREESKHGNHHEEEAKKKEAKPHSPKVLGVSVGGFIFMESQELRYQGAEAEDDVPWSATNLKQYMEWWGTQPPQACVEKNPDEAWQCMSADVSFPTLKTPIFIAQSQTDALQITMHFALNFSSSESKEAYPDSVNPWHIDNKHLQAFGRPLEGGSAEQLKFIKLWSIKMKETFQAVRDHPTAGLFSPACWVHTWMTDGLCIGSASYLDALAHWALDQKVTKLEDECQESDSFGTGLFCNPTCTPSSFFRETYLNSTCLTPEQYMQRCVDDPDCEPSYIASRVAQTPKCMSRDEFTEYEIALSEHESFQKRKATGMFSMTEAADTWAGPGGETHKKEGEDVVIVSEVEGWMGKAAKWVRGASSSSQMGMAAVAVVAAGMVMYAGRGISRGICNGGITRDFPWYLQEQPESAAVLGTATQKAYGSGGPGEPGECKV